tara:strand:- start:21360 stop:22376 length:1017 start_codon:yes stop_codon:yes gene_type:complete
MSSMKTKIAINGFGRIGRNILRAIIEGDNNLDVIAINDSGLIDTNIHLLKYDSIHGKMNNEIKIVEKNIISVDGQNIIKLSDKDPKNLPWKELGIDIVLECTGKFNNKEGSLMHLSSGAKRVLISAPARESHITAVYGVNHRDIDANHTIISNASCTTNALAPLAMVLNDSIGIETAFMTTIHSYTGDQPTLDRNHKDLYRARSAGQSIIPTSTGAASAVGEVIPALKGKIDGVAMRVPTPNVSVIDLKIVASRMTSIDEVNSLFNNAANSDLKGILSITNEKLVSIDINHDPHSAVIAMDQTKVLNKKFVRVMAWYDNEWGFSHRMCDMADHIGQII